MKTHIIRDSFDARRLLVQGLAEGALLILIRCPR